MTCRSGVTSMLAVVAAALPAVAVAQHSGDAHGGADGPAKVAIRASSVDPAGIAVLAGERVEWHNVSVREHTITSRDGLFDSGRIGINRTFGYAFTAAGSFGYYCRIHPYIAGTVDVVQVLLHAPAGLLVSGDQLVLAGRAGPVGGPVTIQRDLGAGFTPLLTVERAANGSFSARFAVDATAAYRAVAGADASPTAARRGRARPHADGVHRPRTPAPAGAGHRQPAAARRHGARAALHQGALRLVDGPPRAPVRRTPRLGRAAASRQGPVRVVLTQPDGETRAAVSRVVRLPR